MTGPRRCDHCHSLPRPMTPQDPGVVLRTTDDGVDTWCVGCLATLVPDEPVRVAGLFERPETCIHGLPLEGAGCVPCWLEQRTRP